MPLIHILTETIAPTTYESLIDTHKTVEIGYLRYYALKAAGAALKRLYRSRRHLKENTKVTVTYYKGIDHRGEILAKYWE